MRLRAPVAVACAVAVASTTAVAVATSSVPTMNIRSGNAGNTIFLHPDGTGLSHWDAARLRWVGPDGALNWDRLPAMAVYRGHMLEQVTGTSNGGATVHAFGYKVEGRGSFGKDGDGSRTPPTDRFILSLSGFNGSILREAQHRGKPVGLVNDGNIGEPGTGAFAAEVGNRNNWNAIAEQIINGRPGMNDPDIQVILGGGERNFLPVGTPRCTPEQAGTIDQDGIRTYPLDCMVHTLDWSKPDRVATPDQPAEVGNLLEQARERGYVVVRTRAEFAQVLDRMQRDRRWTPKVLGLFAAHHIFNDRNEGDLIANGFVSEQPHPFTESDLVLWGNSSPSDPGFDPPMAHELMAMAMELLQRHGLQTNRPYFLVAEPESTDNMGNSNNAAGQLAALRSADEMIRLALTAKRPPRGFRTTVLVAADSDASGMQVRALGSGDNVGGDRVNTQTGQPDVTNPLDGVRGRGTPPFTARPDQFGTEMRFGIAWTGGPDYAGGILARAGGHNAKLLRDFSVRFDNTDVYRFLYSSLFGTALPPSTTQAPSR